MNKATVLSPYAASLTLRRTGLNFIFSASRGSAASPLHRLPKSCRPYRGFKFGFAIARKHPFNFQFIEPFVINQKLKQNVVLM